MKSLRLVLILLLVSILLASLSAPAFAGETEKRIFSGTVNAPDGSPAIDCNIYIYDSQDALMWDSKTTADKFGVFQISLEAGAYWYSAEKVGVGKTGRTRINLIGDDLNIGTITLQPYPSPTATPSPVAPSPSPVASPQTSPIVTVEPSPIASPLTSPEPTISTEPSVSPSVSTIPTPDTTPGASSGPETSSTSMLVTIVVIGLIGIIVARKKN